MNTDDHVPSGDFHDFEPSLDAVRREVLRGLSERPKRIAPKFFYDETGCRLFDEICRLDEYYLTRTEVRILQDNAAEICAVLGPGCRLVELGSGSSTKTRILLDCVPSPAAYVPVDIAREHLLRCSARLSRVYPSLSVLPVCADYTADFRLPDMPGAPRRTVAFFPGSTIGNLELPEAELLLYRLAALCGQGGGLLIGVDLKKNRRTLERAYNDARGVTAAFNLNLLTRINRTFGVSIRTESFRHHAFYNEEFGRIELHLVNMAEQTVRLNGTEIAFGRGESIITEHSYKYTVEEFETLAARSGWTLERLWIDADHLFSVLYLVSQYRG
ncbi:MAG: L-histidine N(alpha)-methyltransferase [Verrucomicrobia bacterium]|nr:L-histidine N(alpha)-methyltransferase [Verrucomicrobiota bacterium]